MDHSDLVTWQFEALHCGCVKYISIKYELTLLCCDAEGVGIKNAAAGPQSATIENRRTLSLKPKGFGTQKTSAGFIPP